MQKLKSMVYKPLLYQVIIRVSLILINSLVFSYFLLTSRNWYTIISLGLLLVIQTILIVNYLNRINRFLSRFLISLKEGDVTTTIRKDLKNLYSEYNKYVEEINKLILNARIEKENQYQYLKYIIEHIRIGLLAFDQKGRVDLINQVAQKFLRFKTLTNISNLNILYGDFEHFLLALKPEEPKLLKLRIADELFHLAFRASEFKLQDKEIKLVSFQDIRAELDEKELDSWKKLIRVLTHEIMNSVTPINTLTRTLQQFYKTNDYLKSVQDIDQHIIEETVEGLNLIEDRGEGLLNFVSKYRSLAKLPEPVFEKFSLVELFNRISTLYKKQCAEKNIELIQRVTPEDMVIIADKNLIEQVIINLVKNSYEALADRDHGIIELSAHLKDDHLTVIRIKDNGHGISEDIMDNIFVPFFTTKDDGSGIGLSLSRQILRLHKGSIDVTSVPGRETTFTLTL